MPACVKTRTFSRSSSTKSIPSAYSRAHAAASTAASTAALRGQGSMRHAVLPTALLRGAAPIGGQRCVCRNGVRPDSIAGRRKELAPDLSARSPRHGVRYFTSRPDVCGNRRRRVLRSDDEGFSLRETNRGLCSRHLSPLTVREGCVFSSVLGEKTRPGINTLPDAASRLGCAWDGAASREGRQVLPGAAGQIYDLTGGALRRSPDGGRSWTLVDTPTPFNSFLVADASSGWLLASSGSSSVFQKRERRQSWEGLELADVGSPIRGLAALSPSATAAIAGARLLLSIDGQRWKFAAELPGNPYIYGLAGAAPRVLLAATSAGLMRSDDFGDSWRKDRRRLPPHEHPGDLQASRPGTRVFCRRVRYRL